MDNNYEILKETIGENNIPGVENYFRFHIGQDPQKLLTNPDIWDDCVRWLEETPEYIKNSEPIYFAIENYKGIAEHNTVGTKEEMLAMLELSEKDFDSYVANGETYYARPNITFFIDCCNSVEKYQNFIHGEYNDEIEREKEGSDWYYSFDWDKSGIEGVRILSGYIDNSWIKTYVPDIWKYQKEWEVRVKEAESIRYANFILEKGESFGVGHYITIGDSFVIFDIEDIKITFEDGTKWVLSEAGKLILKEEIAKQEPENEQISSTTKKEGLITSSDNLNEMKDDEFTSLECLANMYAAEEASEHEGSSKSELLSMDIHELREINYEDSANEAKKQEETDAFEELLKECDALASASSNTTEPAENTSVNDFAPPMENVSLEDNGVEIKAIPKEKSKNKRKKTKTVPKKKGAK